MPSSWPPPLSIDYFPLFFHGKPPLNVYIANPPPTTCSRSLDVYVLLPSPTLIETNLLPVLHSAFFLAFPLAKKHINSITSPPNVFLYLGMLFFMKAFFLFNPSLHLQLTPLSLFLSLTSPLPHSTPLLLPLFSPTLLLHLLYLGPHSWWLYGVALAPGQPLPGSLTMWSTPFQPHLILIRSPLLLLPFVPFLPLLMFHFP